MSTALTHTQRCDAFDAHLAAGTLTRNQWLGRDANGRELPCALAAYSPEVGKAESSSACPGDVIPQWFAHLVPWLDDAGTEAAWPGHMARLGAVLRAWPTLTPEVTVSLHQQVRAACVRAAMAYTQNQAVLSSCESIAVTLERGKWPTNAQRAAAWTAADAAPLEYAWVAEGAARAASHGADAAVRAVMMVASQAASWEAADRLIDRILTLCEEAQSQ